jgi:hypothetical protein
MRRFLILLTIAGGLAAAQAPPKVFPNDTQIEAQLHDKLAKSVIGKDGFTAKIKDGVVYWEGSTDIAQHKGAATRMAKSSGARRVVNNIKVKKTASTKPAARTAAPKTSPEVLADPVPGKAPTSPPAGRVTVKWRDSRP